MIFLFLSFLFGFGFAWTLKRVFFSENQNRHLPDTLMTIGRWSYGAEYSDTKEKYSVSVLMKETPSGKKKSLEFVTSEDRDTQHDIYNYKRRNLILWAIRLNVYQLKLLPWLEGSLTTDDLKSMEDTGIDWVKKPTVEETTNVTLMKEVRNEDEDS